MDVALINGVPIAYRHRPGLGRTIVFAHALGCDQSIWDKVIRVLPRGYGALTYDLRGHGQSGGAADDIAVLADDLSQLCDMLDLTDILFCGISVGGMIGQLLAVDRSDVIKAAVLCNTASRIGSAERWNKRIRNVEDGGLAAFAGDIVGTWFGSDYARQKDRLALHQTMIVRTDAAAYVAACRAIRDADLQHKAVAIAVPILCIGGSQDQSVPPDAVRALSATIPDATSVIMEGIGHLPCLEAPKDFAKMIAAFDLRETDLAKAGDVTRRAVLGNAHVDRASADRTAIDEGFQSLITTGAWGQVWSSPAITARERSMLTLALLAAQGNFEEIPMHVRATKRTGATAQDIAEAFQHVAIYAGVPRANHALKIAKQALADMQADD